MAVMTACFPSKSGLAFNPLPTPSMYSLSLFMVYICQLEAKLLAVKK